VGSIDALDLQAAADELGVHYQTAYRWVRSGRLDAKMIGGRYVVRRDDLAALDEARRTPTAPPAPSSSRVARSANRVHDALVNGDERTIGAIVRKLVVEGSSMIDVIGAVFVPSLRRIGQSWHDGELPVWTEHRASAIVERSLGELMPNPRGRRRGTAMVAAISGDRHSLPTTMAAVALREDNWHVNHLGSDMPADDIARFCAEHDITLAAITVTMPDTADLASATADRLRAADTPTIVGRPGLTLGDLVEQARLAASATAR
jgi:excisionase family DNA binding protein